MSGLEIKSLYVSVHEKQIIENFSLAVPKGEIHAIMGPNGTGKSTLSYTIMGHPAYKPSSGDILMNGERINDWTPDKRSHAGLFLALQYPVAVPGVTVANFLRTALNTQRKARDPEDHGIPVPAFRQLLREKMGKLKMDSSFASRYLNDGFSGGEKKRTENTSYLRIGKLRIIITDLIKYCLLFVKKLLLLVVISDTYIGSKLHLTRIRCIKTCKYLK